MAGGSSRRVAVIRHGHALSALLLSGGLYESGRQVAHRHVVERRPHTRRKTGLMIGLGSGVIGLGIIAIVSGFMIHSTSHTRAVVGREILYWTAIGASLVGPAWSATVPATASLAKSATGGSRVSSPPCSRASSWV